MPATHLLCRRRGLAARRKVAVLGTSSESVDILELNRESRMETEPGEPFSFLGKRARASRANERGRALAIVGRAQEAIAEYERASRLDPTWSMPPYNLGLQYKYSGDWKRSLEYNQRATELDPEDQAGWWNLGIAATALGRWDVARSAWHGAGLQIPDGDGPPNLPCGRTPIRLNPDADGEVVWSRPSRSGPRADCQHSPRRIRIPLCRSRPPRWRREGIPPAGR